MAELTDESSFEQLDRVLTYLWSTTGSRGAQRQSQLDYGKRQARMAVASVVREHTERAVAEVEQERDEIAGRLSNLLCDLTGGLLSKTGYSVRDMVAAIESEFEKVTRQEITAALDEIEKRIEGQRDGFLSSPNLDPAWIAGWQSAVDHVAHVVRGYRQEQDR